MCRNMAVQGRRRHRPPSENRIGQDATLGFTRQGSQVRTLYHPPANSVVFRPFLIWCLHHGANRGEIVLCTRDTAQRQTASVIVCTAFGVECLNRCQDPNHDAFPYYGGRGINLCEEWRESFTAFRRWALINGYGPSKSIDRIDNASNYKPDNCRWVSVKQQAGNRREAKSHLMIEHEGKRQTMLDWSRQTKIGYTTLIKRYHNGVRGHLLFQKIDRAKSHIRPT